MKPLRILVMTTVPQTLAAFFPRQLQSLAESGFDVHVVSSPGEDLNQLNRIPGVTTHSVPMERQPNPRRDVTSLWQLYRLIRRIRPQIVHSHTPKAGLLGMAAAKAAGVPIRLYTIHGLPLETRTGKWRKILEVAESSSAALSTHAYTISRSLQKVVTDLELCPSSKVSTLGDGSCAGVDVERFNGRADWTSERARIRQQLWLPESVILISFLGRLAKDKGVGVLAEAWPRIAAELPEAHLLLGGEIDDTDAVPAPLLDALRRHDRVHFSGSVGKSDVTGVYAATDIFVLPSFREGLSQVALEAGAMGVPIVSTRVTGLVDAVRDGVTGTLVPAHESVPLADAIIHLARNGTLRQAYGEAAHHYIRSAFSEDRVNRLWLAEYRQLIQQSLPELIPSLAQMETRI
jgi:glycosyltransferase involved in cell wall biosynthesis